VSDASTHDAASIEAGRDAAGNDARATDDATASDAASVDAMTSDAGAVDAAAGDATMADAGTVCTFGINPSSSMVQSAGGTGTFDVTASPAGCAWTPVADVAWLTVTTPGPFTGSATVGYTAGPFLTHAGPARVGHVVLQAPAGSVGTLSFTLTQSHL
jgi:hypothetical protein